MAESKIKFLKRNVFQRLFGICATGMLADTESWSVGDNVITIELDRVPELANPGGAVRLEGKNLPERILVVHGEDGEYHAFLNKCVHGNRRLDPVPGTNTVQCCSIGKSTFDLNGNHLFGAVRENVDVFPVETENGKILIKL